MSRQAPTPSRRGYTLSRRDHTPSRRGYTLLEVLVATLVAAVALGILLRMTVGASSMFVRGEEVVHGERAARQLLDTLERDLLGCLQIPGDPRPPLVFSKEGSLYFFRAEIPGSIDDPVEGIAVHWDLVQDGPGQMHAVRNGVHLRGLGVGGWEMNLLAPSKFEGRAGWFLSVRIKAANPRGVSMPVQARRIRLPQPSSNFLHFPVLESTLPGQVRMHSTGREVGLELLQLGAPQVELSGGRP